VIWSAVLVLIASSVAAAWAATPQGATGNTPVRYVICRAGGTDCEVFARFRNRSECEDFREFSEMSCDRQSVPGTITCKAAPRVTGGPRGYCQD
jgi:hypothetical protein